MKSVRIFRTIFLCVFGSFLLAGVFASGIVVYEVASVKTIAVEMPRLSDALLKEDIQPIYSYDEYGSGIYFDAFDQVQEDQIVSVETTSMIVPHHLIAANEIASMFTSVASEDVKTVVLISPNHFSVGVSPAQVSFGTWETPFGELYTSNRNIQKLIDEVEVLENEELAFSGEHGIGGLTPFIKHSFPNATFVPIIVDESFSEADRDALAAGIVEEFPDAFVIGSIDMSHNLPDGAADFHDGVTLDVLEAGDRCRKDCVDVEIDSQATLDTVLAVNEARGMRDWHLVYHGSVLDDASDNLWRDNTSHIIGYFTEGEPNPERFATVHFVGDIMLDRGVRIKMNQYGVEYPWEEMERFLRGTHMVVGNLEGTVNEQASTYTYNPPFRFVFAPESVTEMNKYVDVVSLANNHARDVGSAGETETQQRLDEMGIPWFGGWAEPIPRYDTTIDGIDISFIGYHQFHPNETLLQEQIREADAEGRFVIVMPHWGNEYQHTPSSSQRRLAQLMVDAGADLIIGGHPHVVQGIEQIDDVLVVYSLGNFVFDQQIASTWPALTVGMTLTEEYVTLQLLPVYTKDSQPTPLSASEATTVISTIANASQTSLQEQIFETILTTQYAR